MPPTRRLPSVRPRQVRRALEKAGFAKVRQRGSHLYLARQGISLVVIPMHTKDLKRGTLVSILRQAGLSRSEFLDLLS